MLFKKARATRLAKKAVFITEWVQFDSLAWLRKLDDNIYEDDSIKILSRPVSSEEPAKENVRVFYKDRLVLDYGYIDYQAKVGPRKFKPGPWIHYLNYVYCEAKVVRKNKLRR